MKPVITLLFMAIMISTLTAQESKSESTQAQSQAAPKATVDPFSSEPLPLIPETPGTGPKTSSQASPAQPAGSPGSVDKASLAKTTAADADDLRGLVRFREVKTLALRDPKVQRQWEVAESAETIPGKIAALKEYYVLLYARMLAIDGSLKPRIEKSKTEAFVRIDTPADVSLNPPVHGRNWAP
jgi:hypothetical protein